MIIFLLFNRGSNDNLRRNPHITAIENCMVISIIKLFIGWNFDIIGINVGLKRNMPNGYMYSNAQ